MAPSPSSGPGEDEQSALDPAPGARRNAESDRAEAHAARLLQLNEALRDEFEVIRPIGDESFGSLFLAREVPLRRPVVIKVLRDEFIHNEEARLRFEREARAAARITHPNVVQVFRVGTLPGGVPFLVEPWVGECTLRDRLKSVGRFQPGEVRRIVAQLAAALEAAHQSGTVHRDVCLSTVRCEADTERMLLTDFGIAGVLETAGIDEVAITRPGEVLGHADSMSPEQSRGGPATERSDVYSLGVLAWRLLAGAAAPVPEVGETMDRAALLTVAPDDSELVDLIIRCLREQPSDRPDAGEIVRRLESTPSGPPSGWSELIARRIPHVALLVVSVGTGFVGLVTNVLQVDSRWRWLMGVLLGAVLAAALVLTWFHGRKGRQAVSRLELGLIAAIVVLWLGASLAVFRLIGSG